MAEMFGKNINNFPGSEGQQEDGSRCFPTSSQATPHQQALHLQLLLNHIFCFCFHGLWDLHAQVIPETIQFYVDPIFRYIEYQFRTKASSSARGAGMAGTFTKVAVLLDDTTFRPLVSSSPDGSLASLSFLPCKIYFMLKIFFTF